MYTFDEAYVTFALVPIQQNFRQRVNQMSQARNYAYA